MLIEALLFGGALYALGKGADAADKTAYIRLDDKEFDKENARYGILHQLDEEKLHKIAARCRIRKDREGRFRYNDTEKCKYYVQRYALNQNDYKQFEKQWKELVYKQEMAYRDKIKKQSNNMYQSAKDYYGTKKPGNIEYVFEINHWGELNPVTHRDRVKRLQEETFIGDITIQDPIIRDFRYERYETWVLSLPNKYHADNDASVIYGLCCKHLGWIK